MQHGFSWRLSGKQGWLLFIKTFMPLAVTRCCSKFLSKIRLKDCCLNNTMKEVHFKFRLIFNISLWKVKFNQIYQVMQ